jgi:hypothetical protein
MSSKEDYDDDEFFDAAAFEEESVKEMLAESSDKGEETSSIYVVISCIRPTCC